MIQNVKPMFIQRLKLYYIVVLARDNVVNMNKWYKKSE